MTDKVINLTPTLDQQIGFAVATVREELLPTPEQIDKYASGLGYGPEAEAMVRGWVECTVVIARQLITDREKQLNTSETPD